MENFQKAYENCVRRGLAKAEFEQYLKEIRFAMEPGYFIDKLDGKFIIGNLTISIDRK
ncbi:MAG: hypothetical protein WCI36_04255 [bacterium]